LGHKGEESRQIPARKRKATAKWLFFNGQSLASQGFSGSARLRDEKLRLRLVLVEPSSARRILKRRTRIYASHVRRWLHS
jgi:hypothetical protein